MLHFHALKPYELSNILPLWQSVFRDDEKYIRQCLTVFAGPGHVFAAQEEGRFVAQLLAVPCLAGGVRGAYLFALATAPEFRGKGVMSALMKASEAAMQLEGAAFFVLIPAEESLYNYYTERGYTNRVGVRRFSVETQDAGDKEVHITPLVQRDFMRARETYLPQPWAAFSPPRSEMIARELEGEGFLFAESKEAYAIYTAVNGNLLVPEIGAVSDEAGMALLHTVAAREQCSKIVVTVPAAGSLFAGRGVIGRAGLYKQVSEDVRLPNLYFRFGFDEIVNEAWGISQLK